MRRALIAVCLAALAGCSCTSVDSDKAGMTCVRGHDEPVKDTSGTVFICDEYLPATEGQQ